MNYVKLTEGYLRGIPIGRHRLAGMLLARGNLIDGGQCWLVPDWESREVDETRLQLEPEDLLVTLLDHLEAFGGGDYVLMYPAEVEGDVHESADGRRGMRAFQIDVTNEDELIRIDIA